MSLLTTILATAAEGGEAETSKTLFYVLGGALAVLAVLIGALGLAKHDFPADHKQRNGLMAVVAVFVLGAMASAIITG